MKRLPQCFLCFCLSAAGLLHAQQPSAPPFPTGGLALAGSAMRFEQLPRQLTQFVTRPVYDRTGLSGEYDILLRALPEPGAGLAFGPPAAAAPDSDVPSIFTALQEQLGLRLESARGPVDVLVVDSVAQPTED